jgi:hypothetical protein
MVMLYFYWKIIEIDNLLYYLIFLFKLGYIEIILIFIKQEKCPICQAFVPIDLNHLDIYRNDNQIAQRKKMLS